MHFMEVQEKNWIVEIRITKLNNLELKALKIK